MSESQSVPELPDPSPELILILGLVQAFLEVAPKKRRQRFLAAMDRNLGFDEARYNVIRFRPASQDAAVYAALRTARAWWRYALGALTWMGE